MHNYTTVIVLICFVLLSCNERGKYDPKDSNKTDTFTKALLIADSLKYANAKFATYNSSDMQLFCNNKITPYCVLLPLKEMKEDFNEVSITKAQHKFILRQDTKAFNSIEVQAFTIDKKNYYNTKLFYQRDKKNVEEGGLGIDTSYINEANHLYLIKGYLPDYMNMRFVQINWIQSNRIAVYFNYYDKDEALWMSWINAIIKRGVTFSDR